MCVSVCVCVCLLYILFDCLYGMLPVIRFSLLVPDLSPPLFIFSFDNRPAPFPGRMSQKVTEPGFNFLCLFCVVIHFFWLVNFVELGLVVFRTKPK